MIRVLSATCRVLKYGASISFVLACGYLNYEFYFTPRTAHQEMQDFAEACPHAWAKSQTQLATGISLAQSLYEDCMAEAKTEAAR